MHQVSYRFLHTHTLWRHPYWMLISCSFLRWLLSHLLPGMSPGIFLHQFSRNTLHLSCSRIPAFRIMCLSVSMAYSLIFRKHDFQQLPSKRCMRNKFKAFHVYFDFAYIFINILARYRIIN